MEGMSNAYYRVFVDHLERKCLGDVEINGRKIIKLILKK